MHPEQRCRSVPSGCFSTNNLMAPSILCLLGPQMVHQMSHAAWLVERHRFTSLSLERGMGCGAGTRENGCAVRLIQPTSACDAQDLPHQVRSGLTTSPVVPPAALPVADALMPKLAAAASAMLLLSP